MANVRRKESVSWRAEKKGKSRGEKDGTREKKGERISVISVDNAVYAASKHNDTTFAK